VNDEGKPVSAFGGKYFGVPAYLFAATEVEFHPGAGRISHICPCPPGFIVEMAPSV
jgi:hypothetical protein